MGFGSPLKHTTIILGTLLGLHVGGFHKIDREPDIDPKFGDLPSWENQETDPCILKIPYVSFGAGHKKRILVTASHETVTITGSYTGSYLGCWGSPNQRVTLLGYPFNKHGAT